MKKILLILFFLVMQMLANDQEFFLKGNKFLREGDVASALDNYRKMKEKGPAVWCNMGMCYYESEQYLKALIAFERAQKNLTLQQSQQIAEYISHVKNILDKSTDNGFLHTWLSKINQSTRKVSLFWLQILFLLIWYLLFFLLRKKVFSRNAMYVGMYGLVLIACIGVMSIKYHAQIMQTGFVVNATPIYSGPSEEYHVRARLDVADDVVILKNNGEWCQVSKNDTKGWIKQTEIALI